MATAKPGRTPLTSGLDQRVQETNSAEGARKSESYLIDLIDKADTLRAHHDIIEKLNTGTLDTPGFIRALAPQAALEVLNIMRTAESEKVKLDAAKDLLDRAGHTKTTKVAVGHMNIDHQTSKRELVNMILSSAKKAGIEAVRKDVDDENTIDVKPEPSKSGVPDKSKKGKKASSGGAEVYGEES